MASPAVTPGSFRQVGPEKRFSMEDESGLHVTNRVREYAYTPSPEHPPSDDRNPSEDNPSEFSSNTANTMRLRSVAVVGGALALAVLKAMVGRRKPKIKSSSPLDAAKDAASVSPEAGGPSPLTSAEMNRQPPQASDAISVGIISAGTTPARASSRLEDAEEGPELGSPRSTRTVSSAGGGPLRSTLSVDGSQNQRLQSHRKETISKLRQQLQGQDEMILDMQQQLAAQEHFTRESRSIVAELEQQLKTALEGGQKLGLENQRLTEERQQLEAELSNERGEKAALVEENRQLRGRISELGREEDKLEKLQETMKQLEEERHELESTLKDQQGALQKLERERESLQKEVREKGSISEQSSVPEQKELTPKMKSLAAENERMKEELQALREQSLATAAQERADVEDIQVVKKDLERFQKMLRGKDRLIEGYEKERVHLTAVLKELEHKAESKQRELEALQSGTTAADVQSSNNSEAMAAASSDRDEEAHSKPRNMHLIRSFDNPLSDLSPEESPNRRLSTSRSHDSKLLDGSVYPSPNGVLENVPRQLSMDTHLKGPNGTAHHRATHAEELSDGFQTVAKKASETDRLIENLQRRKEVIVDLERKMGKEEELGIKEDSWLEGDTGYDEEESPTAMDPSAQAAILSRKLEQLARQRAAEEELAKKQQDESAIARLRSRMASLSGKANGAEVKSDVLGAELARKLAQQEQQSPDALNEVQRMSATFHRGSLLFAKAQDELVRNSMSGIEMMKAEMGSAANAGGHRSADGLDRRYSFDSALGYKPNGLDRKWSGNHVRAQQRGTFSVPNGTMPDSPPSNGAPRDELARLTVEVERELSQDFGKRLNGNGPHGWDLRSQGSGEMDLGEEDGNECVANKKVGSEGESDASLADMLESTLDDMVRMCTPAPSQANSPFPKKMR